MHAGDKRIGVVVEGERDERQAEQAFAPQLDGARGAIERALERHGDAALDLLGRVAGHLRDHRDLRVGDVGIGLDRRVEIGAHAEGSEDGDREDRRGAPVHADFD